MKYHHSKKISLLIIFIFFLLLASGVYLNRSYAYIYDKIGKANLPEVNQEKEYLISTNMAATTSIIYAALGDSLTAGVGVTKPEEGLSYLLAQKLSGEDKKIILKNYAVPGYKTADLISTLLPQAIKADPEIVTLLIGTNDVHNQVSISEFRRNYEEILSRLTKETRAKVYVINIPFIGADKMMLPPYQFYFAGRTQEFNAVIKELATQYQVDYIDLYGPSESLFKKAGDHYSADLFHPSASGYKIWADIIYDSINK